MIQKTQSFQTSDGQVHSTLGAAKRAELEILLQSKSVGEPSEAERNLTRAVINRLAENSDAVLAILRTKERKPRAVKVSKPRKARTATVKPVDTTQTA